MHKFIMNIIERILNGKFISKDELTELLKTYYENGKEVGYKEGYDECLKKYDKGRQTSSFKSGTNDIGFIDTAILFVKADRGLTVIESIRKEGKLNPSLAESLYENTHKIWAGSKTQLDQIGISCIFNLEGARSEFGPEYDSIAIMVKITNSLSTSLSDSFRIHEFINRLCEWNGVCDSISQRLPLKVIQKYNLIDV